MTVRLYYDDSYLTEFEARIVEQYRRGDAFAVILDRTAFYPTSGGQQHDKGWLNGKPVLDVVEERDEVLHLVEEPFVEEVVKGQVDWERRFVFMQQHTAFHILAQSFLRELRAETLSSHLGETVSTIDVDLESIDWQQVKKVEELANRIIQENRPVRAFFVEPEKLEEMRRLRKFPDAAFDRVRLVEIEDFDLDPCGGTHVRRTGEVGAVKIIGWDKVRRKVRLTFLAGRRVLPDYQRRVEILQRLGQLLSAKPEELAEQVERLQHDLKGREREIRRLRERLTEAEIDRLLSAVEKSSDEVQVLRVEGFFPKEIRRMALTLAGRQKSVFVLAQKPLPGYAVVARSDSLPVNLRQLLDGIRQKLSLKGGGAEHFIELAEITEEKLEQLAGAIRQQLQTML